MKKTLYFALFAMILLVAGGFVSTNLFAYADLPNNVTCSGLNMALYDEMTNLNPISDSNNNADLPFHNFDETSAFDAKNNNPYGTFYIGIKVDTQPIYDGLTDDEKLQIFRDVTGHISINGTAVSFGNNEVVNEGNYILYAPELSDYYANTLIFIRITPLKAGVTSISCDVYGHSAFLTINCEYATPSTLTLSYDESLLNQLYENFEPIIFTAIPNYQDWLDPNTPIVYEWSLNFQVISGQTSDTLTVTADMIAVGNFTIVVTIPNTTLQTSANFHITTEESYQVTIDVNGKLEFIYGEDLQPITTFTATIPVQDSYTVDWYLKSPEDSVYTHQTNQTTPKSYDFISTQFGIGEYKIFAVVEYNSKNYYSEITTIKINPETLDEDKNFEITVVEYTNRYTGLTAYRFSINANNYFLNDQIVWFVRDDNNGSRRAQVGFTFDFQPTEVRNYVITVWSQVGSSLTQLNTGESITPRRVGPTSDIWIYLVIAAVAILALGIISTLIANKAREKIW